MTQLAVESSTRETKLCPKCDASKPLDAFGRSKNRPGSLAGWCKVCKAADMRRRRNANRPKRAPRKKRAPNVRGLAALMRDRHADFGGSRQ